MENPTQRQPRSKEIFMADAQQNYRACALLHCTYIIEPVSHFQVLPANTVIDAITNKLSISKSMTVHRSTDEKIIVSFPYHEEAVQAVRLGATPETFRINGMPCRFSPGDMLAHSRTITLCRQVFLTLRCLPLHMWTGPIVEQIPSPYCALEYIDQETRTMDDPSAFTCIVRCQKAVPIPDEISIRVPQEKPPQNLASPIFLFLNRYTIFLDKTQYIHGVTRRCIYKSEPTATSVSYIVTPAECYISPRMFDVGAIQIFSSAVILHPIIGTYFADLCHVCAFVKENLHIRVQVKMLNDTAFAIPSMVRVRIVPFYLTDLTQISPDSKCKCPLLDVFLQADAILDGVSSA